jgi:hypothetical protein
VDASPDVHPSNARHLWAFGGFNDNDGAIAALECLDVRPGLSHGWDRFTTPPFVVDGPVGRFGHTCTLVGGSLYVVGGCTGSSNYKGHSDGEELSDVWKLDLGRPRDELRWEQIDSICPYPDALQRCHSAVRVGTKVLFFAGGGPGNVTNMLCAFDTAVLRGNAATKKEDGGAGEKNSTTTGPPSQWSAPRVANQSLTRRMKRATMPCPRQNQSSALIPGTGLMMVFGGALALTYGDEVPHLFVAFVVDICF